MAARDYLTPGFNPFNYFTPGFNPKLPHPMDMNLGGGGRGFMGLPPDSNEYIDDMLASAGSSNAPTGPQFHTAPGIDDADLIDEYYKTARAPLRKQTGGEKIRSIIRNVLTAGAQPARFAGTAPDILAAAAGTMGGLQNDDLLHQALAEKDRARELDTLGGMITQRQKAATTRASVLADTEKANKEVWDREIGERKDARESRKPIVAGNAVLSSSGDKVLYAPPVKPSNRDAQQADLKALFNIPGFNPDSPEGQRAISHVFGRPYRPPAPPRPVAPPTDPYLRLAHFKAIAADDAADKKIRDDAKRQVDAIESVLGVKQKRAVDLRKVSPPRAGRQPTDQDKFVAQYHRLLNDTRAESGEDLSEEDVLELALARIEDVGNYTDDPDMTRVRKRVRDYVAHLIDPTQKTGGGGGGVPKVKPGGQKKTGGDKTDKKIDLSKFER